MYILIFWGFTGRLCLVARGACSFKCKLWTLAWCRICGGFVSLVPVFTLMFVRYVLVTADAEDELGNISHVSGIC
jgi:hypothetical protein